MNDLQGFLEKNKVQKLIEAATRIRDKLLFRLLFVTGARISEILGDHSWYEPQGTPRIFYGLRVKDVIPKENAVVLDTLKRKRYPPPKRRVIIDKKTMQMLQEYIKTCELTSEQKVFNITRQRAFQIIRELGKKTGLNFVGQKRIHNHHMRHSHCVAYVKKNNTLEGLRKLQRKLGHASINTTAHYLQFSPEQQKEIEDIFGE